jgi:putative copper export protein
MLALSGVVGALVHVVPLSALLSSAYGRILLTKLALVGMVIAAGWFNWKRHSARITIDEGDALHAGAIRELVAATAVIIATAVLIGTELPLD